MNKQIDKFLLGLLWLLAMTLGISFWFNTKYGFNIFSIPHWDYLGGQQASDTIIKSSFYLSLVISVFIMIFGFYLIIRKRLRRIWTIGADTAADKPPMVITNETIISVPVPAPAPAPGINLVRPPRLNLGMSIPPAPINPMGAIINTGAPEIIISDEIDTSEISEIFTNAGFIIKKAPKIGGIRCALIAIGANETIWVGGISISKSGLEQVCDELNNIFTETLDDIEINIKSFILNPIQNNIDTVRDIMTFNSNDDLRNFINQNQNPKLSESDMADFNAYSEYVDTVLNYFNKT